MACWVSVGCRMNMKMVIALMLGLVFQLAQVMAGGLVIAPCPLHAQSCECCLAGKVCHCADNGDSDQKPPPTPVDAGCMLKIAAMKTVETRVSVDQWCETDASATVEVCRRMGPLSGYAGARLSVAFCSFVI